MSPNDGRVSDKLQVRRNGSIIQCLIRPPFAEPLGVVRLEYRNSRASPRHDSVTLRHAPEIALVGGLRLQFGSVDRIPRCGEHLSMDGGSIHHGSNHELVLYQRTRAERIKCVLLLGVPHTVCSVRHSSGLKERMDGWHPLNVDLSQHGTPPAP